MSIKTILFLVGMIVFALLSYLAKPISNKLKKEEVHIKIVGLAGCLLFAILLLLS